jgi:putative Mg2+ transporter-C (MgtC) family protein
MDYLYNILDIIEADKSFIIRLIIAVALGALVGFERQSRGRSAGLRTNILVCLGSAAVVVAFEKLTLGMNLDSGSIIRMDPARVAAGVITGVGFLGAGTIIKNTNFVRGLTTAASIWIVSAIGITVGLGEYTIAFFLTGLVLITLYALHYIPVRSDNYFSLTLDWTGDIKLLKEIVDKLKSEKVIIKSRNMKFEPKAKKCRATLGMRMRCKWHDKPELEELCKDTRFDKISWQ